MQRPFLLERDFLELQRKTAKGYTCPVCGEVFQAEPKLWDHGSRTHQGYLADLGSMEKAEGAARRLFRQEALDHTQHIITGKAGSAAEDRSPPAKRYLDLKAPTGEYTFVSAKASSQGRPVSAPEYSQEPHKRIEENIGDLSLEHARSKKQDARPIPANNPRKRGVEGESRSPDPPIGSGLVEHLSTRPRHGKTLSGGRHPDSGRQGAPPDASDYRREISGPKQPLWDPSSDSPNTVKSGRRDKQHGHSNPLRRFLPPKDFYSTYQGPEPAEDDTVQPPSDFGHRGPVVQHIADDPGRRAKQPISPSTGGEKHGSQSPTEGDFPEDNPPDGLEDEPEMLLQPETRPISHEQLVVEVKGIYAGLVLVEAKCIDIDERQNAAAQEKDPSKKTELKNDQWQSLIALHKQLLHEHHDFFLASQHPSASQALSRLAAKYSMPARMWRHGIHAFLEVLRHRLPGSLEHMLAFIYIAYSMMALLYETVPAFEDTWIECLGDLGRYRMAIEDDEPRDREVWSNVAKFWYNKASDKSPNTGRLYHHMAILARPYTLEQLSLYARSLTCVNPFESAKGSIMTLFNPVLQSKDATQRRPSSFETVFIRAHAIFFASKPMDSSELFNTTVDELEKDDLFDKFITRAGARFKEIGAYAAISNIAALFEYGYAKDGASGSRLRLVFEDTLMIKEGGEKSAAANSSDPVNLPPPTGPPDTGFDNPMTSSTNDSVVSISQPSRLTSITLEMCLKRPKDNNVYPLVHVYLGFLWSLIIVLRTCKYFEQDTVLKTIERYIPWISLCSFLNTLALDPQVMTSRVWDDEFPRPVKETGRPLPEDFIMRGQLYTQWYFVANWFTAYMADDDERSHDLPSMAQPRKERILWLGLRIASAQRWIRFDTKNECFSTTEYVAKFLAANAEPKSVSYGHDTVMSEADTAEYTPRTMSIAATESLNTSRASTRASTPTEVFESDPVALPMTPRAGDPVAASDDVPMMDISPGKENRASPLRESQTFDDRSSTPIEGLKFPPYVDGPDGNHPTNPPRETILDSHDVPK